MKTESMMNRSDMIRTSFPIVGLTAILALFLAPSPSVAHEPDVGIEQTVSSRAEIPAARIAEARNILVELTDLLHSIGAQRGVTRTMTSAKEAREAIVRMTDEDLAIYADEMSQIEQLVVALRSVETLVELSTMRTKVISRLAQSHPEAAGSLPPGGYSTGPLGCGNTRTATGIVRGVLIALQIGRGVDSALDRACSQTVAGFNTNAVCIVSALILLGLETAYDQLDFCVADIDSAEIVGTYDRMFHIHEHLDSMRTGSFSEGSSSSSLSFNKELIIGARDLIIAEILATGAAVITAIEDFATKIQLMIQVGFDEQNLVLRKWRLDSLTLWIEADLGRQTDSDRIAQFQLPEAIVCDLPDIPCASIERVIKIVLETISTMEAAGQPTYGAQDVFEQGQVEYNAGNYKTAYGLFVQAYLLATDLQDEQSGSTSRGGGTVGSDRGRSSATRR